MQTDNDMEKSSTKTGLVWVAAGVAFLVAVAVALMSGEPPAPPAAPSPAAQPPAASPAGAQAPATAPAAAPPAAAAAGKVQPPAEIRAALESAQPPAGSLMSRVYFDTGSAALDEDGRATVSKAARTLSAGLAARVALSGYVDASGSAAANAELAKQRAQAVRDALLAAGVPADAVELRKPQQVTAEGGADAARRVEILLLR